MNNQIANRYDFILLFDVKDGNPNGDPDAGNLPRVDPETGEGLVTDVCLKRKVRNYVSIIKGYGIPYDIYVKEKAVLGRAHFEAFRRAGIQLGEESIIPIPANIVEGLLDLGLPEGLRIEEKEDTQFFFVEADMDKKVVKEWLKETKPDRETKKFMDDLIKAAKSRKPSGEEVQKGRDEMCKRFYDVRTFGAVMSLKSAPNCGQVRGPVQLTFARSIDQAISLEHSITRMAVATEAEAEKQQGDNRTMGRKYTVPYALYRCHGFVSGAFAAQTGFNEEDLALFWDALKNMFDHDRSAARGEMNSRKLIVFKHDGIYGNAPAHSLFERLTVERKDLSKPARAYSDYKVTLDKDSLPSGVTVEQMV